MKIGVISDTHGNVSAWQKAIKLLGDVDLILHAGDVLYHPPRLSPGEGYDIPELARLINKCPIPVIIARGNCDAEVYQELLEIPTLSPYAFVYFGEKAIVMSHGHALTNERMAEIASRYRADIIITGHTHIPVVERIGRAIHINPGSPTHSKLERDGVPIATVGLICDGLVQVLDLETGEEVSALVTG